jgi:gliding motility-associated-like protein
VKDIDQFNGNIVQIYNRWGELIFEDNCSQECWDGKIDGKDAPVGAYYYIIDHNDGSELLKGSITLVR